MNCTSRQTFVSNDIQDIYGNRNNNMNNVFYVICQSVAIILFIHLIRQRFFPSFVIRIAVDFITIGIGLRACVRRQTYVCLGTWLHSQPPSRRFGCSSWWRMAPKLSNTVSLCRVAGFPSQMRVECWLSTTTIKLQVNFITLATSGPFPLPAAHYSSTF